mgnify:CR=1 FL=1
MGLEFNEHIDALIVELEEKLKTKLNNSERAIFNFAYHSGVRDTQTPKGIVH